MSGVDTVQMGALLQEAVKIKEKYVLKLKSKILFLVSQLISQFAWLYKMRLGIPPLMFSKISLFLYFPCD